MELKLLRVKVSLTRRNWWRYSQIRNGGRNPTRGYWDSECRYQSSRNGYLCLQPVRVTAVLAVGADAVPKGRFELAITQSSQ